MNRPEAHYPHNVNSRYKRYRFRKRTVRNRLISPLGIPQKRTTINIPGTNKKSRTQTKEQSIPLVRSNSLVQSLKLIAQSISIISSIALLILMSIAVWSTNTYITKNYWVIVSFVLITLGLFVGSYLLSNRIRKQSFVIFVSVLLIIALLKIVFISMYALHPTSDFFNYHYFAFVKASGLDWSKKLIGTNLYFPHVLNIAMLFSIPYSIVGTNFVTSQILNIVLTLFDAILIYKLGTKIFNQQAGIFAGLIFSLIPAYFLYSTLNGAEPMFITAFLGMMCAFITFIQHDNGTTTGEWVASFRNLAILSIITYMIRPTIGIWIVAGLIYLFFIRYPYKLDRKFKFKRLAYFVGFAAVFMLFSIFSTSLFSQMYKLPFLNNSVNDRYSLATGTSVSTHGQYNGKYYNKLSNDLKESTSTAELNKKATTDMNKQVKANVTQLNKSNGWLPFLSDKYAAFSNENYGYNWILFNTWNKNPYKKAYMSSRNALVAFSSIFLEFMIIISIVIMSLILFFRRKIENRMQTINHIFYLSLLLDGFILGSMLFEVQGRYHVILYIPLVLILGAGAKILGERRKKLTVLL
ncbi:ArnT family glycosyltransferase [Companilactobacillus ginsenosidimutans]|uniref:Glycosyltransferase RgtA/B/C/D-like domain-containing protein n=1 Tax=Companilactobacillus ginsenosidimutans TaxID=1007676 RepID=A0A0H4QD98_9LACO|nr:glycosyltransferase family 39 protein [Companilactobacillus ginsenosidimutans]AKP66309.1 hypothetical protein ABM34_01245 [Companilactobacillus ginsenosidimutans]